MLRPGPSSLSLSLSLSDPAGKTARVPVSMRATGGGKTQVEGRGSDRTSRRSASWQGGFGVVSLEPLGGVFVDQPFVSQPMHGPDPCCRPTRRLQWDTHSEHGLS